MAETSRAAVRTAKDLTDDILTETREAVQRSPVPTFVKDATNTAADMAQAAASVGVDFANAGIATAKAAVNEGVDFGRGISNGVTGAVDFGVDVATGAAGRALEAAEQALDALGNRQAALRPTANINVA